MRAGFIRDGHIIARQVNPPHANLLPVPPALHVPEVLPPQLPQLTILRSNTEAKSILVRDGYFELGGPRCRQLLSLMQIPQRLSGYYFFRDNEGQILSQRLLIDCWLSRRGACQDDRRCSKSIQSKKDSTHDHKNP